jgi:hypothetical protein
VRSSARNLVELRTRAPIDVGRPAITSSRSVCVEMIRLYAPSSTESIDARTCGQRFCEQRRARSANGSRRLRTKTPLTREAPRRVRHIGQDANAPFPRLLQRGSRTHLGSRGTTYPSIEPAWSSKRRARTRSSSIPSTTGYGVGEDGREQVCVGRCPLGGANPMNAAPPNMPAPTPTAFASSLRERAPAPGEPEWSFARRPV